MKSFFAIVLSLCIIVAVVNAAPIDGGVQLDLSKLVNAVIVKAIQQLIDNGAIDLPTATQITVQLGLKLNGLN